MSLIQVTDLSFTYESGSEPVFEHVSFQIDTDWKLGFIGRNGRGKTTFLKLLMAGRGRPAGGPQEVGEAYEYTGSIHADVPFDYFPFLVEDGGRDTWEVADGLIGGCEAWRLMRELSKLQVAEEALYRPFGTLSGGERTKVLLAALFLKERRFLLIDEPTNHLDQEGRRLVSRYLNAKKGFILVSHDREFLDGCVDHILSINRAGIEVQRGDFSCWKENRDRQDAFELAQEWKLRRDIQQLKETARQSGQWADKVEATKIGRKSRVDEKCIDTRAYIGEKSRRMQKRRKNLERRQERAVEEKSKLLKNLEEAEALKLMPLSWRRGCLLRVRDLTVDYGCGPVCAPVGLTMEAGERVGLTGINGCGKSSLLKLMQGQGIPYRGAFQMAGGLIVSYISQDTSFLRGSLTDYAEASGVEETLLKALLRKLDFSRAQFERPMESYSEGQKKKVLIAGSLCQQAHLYLWDEPLNYVDLYSRMQLEDLILEYRPTMVLVEHDAAFLRKIATRTVEIRKTGA